MKIHIISLGCPKNLVDSESIAGILSAAGHDLCLKPAEADAIVINTCAFIGSAVKESESTIYAASKYGKKLIVCGCLPQIKGEGLKEEFPQVHAFLGTGEIHKIAKALNEIETGSPAQRGRQPAALWEVGEPGFVQNSGLPRKVSTGKSYAYLKISEGCDNRCSYCLIPQIRGAYRSRPANDIIKEGEKLAGSGIKELILIGQDTTAHPELVKILEKLSKIKSVEWVRLLYTHPRHLSDRIIDTIASSEKICKYVDLPLQHTRDEILKKMGRPPAKQSFRLIEKMRKKIPDIAIRSTVIVGFPGETDKIFRLMAGDIKEIRLDWLGCFEYSAQDRTKAAGMPGQVTAKEKKARYNKIMSVQQVITGKINACRVGKRFKVIVDSKTSGHAEFQCPEIDGCFLLKNAAPGSVIQVIPRKVSDIYDLA